MRALLDVNVLIALLDAGHVHHVAAARWLEANLASGWASCPITQTGCVRIMSQPAYPEPRLAAQVAERLAEAAADPSHEFWPADVNLLDSNALDWSRLLGHRQVTDAYLLALAVSRNGRLVSFDQRIARDIVANARDDHLVVLS